MPSAKFSPHIAATLSGPKTDERIVEALEQYYEVLDAGRSPDRREFLGRYPEIADELGRCLDNIEFIENVAPQLSDAGDGVRPRSRRRSKRQPPWGISASSGSSGGAAWGWFTRRSSFRWAGGWR